MVSFGRANIGFWFSRVHNNLINLHRIYKVSAKAVSEWTLSMCLCQSKKNYNSNSMKLWISCKSSLVHWTPTSGNLLSDFSSLVFVPQKSYIIIVANKFQCYVFSHSQLLCQFFSFHILFSVDWMWIGTHAASRNLFSTWVDSWIKVIWDFQRK